MRVLSSRRDRRHPADRAHQAPAMPGGFSAPSAAATVRLVEGVAMMRNEGTTTQGTVADEDAAASLQAILACIAQPVWVVDSAGTLVFANPAAVSALGYDDLDELLGCNSHETIHYKRPDGSPYPAEDCPLFNLVR